MSKKKTAVAQSFPYTVETRQECLHSEREEGQFGSWSEKYSNSVGAVRKGGEWPDVVSTHNFASGDDAYLVWLEYSSGDSFGSSDRGYVQILGLFKDGKAAAELATKLRSESSYRENGYDITTSDGQRFTCGFAAWRGYFDNLDDIHIERVVIQ